MDTIKTSDKVVRGEAVRAANMTQGEHNLQLGNLARAEEEVAIAKEALAANDSKYPDGDVLKNGVVPVAKTADDVRAENKADALRGSDNTVYTNTDGSVTKTVAGKVVPLKK